MTPTVHNWARNQACAPQSVAVPRDAVEVAQLVASAGRLGRRVRVIGGGHSWSAAAMTDDVLLRLDRLSGIQAVRGTDVTVGAGTRVRDLHPALHRLGLALSNVGSIGEQSIAGAISTATHGSSLAHGVMSTQVVGLELVTADGSVRSVSAQESPALFDAARVGLGALGVITAVTLRCEPSFRVAVEARPLPVSEAVAQAAELAHAAEYSKVWWLPHTDQAVLFVGHRTDEAVEPRAVADWLDREVVNPWLFAGVLGLGNAVPRAIPALNALVAAAYFRPDRRVQQSFDALHIPVPPVHLETEWALPLERAPQALGGVRDLIGAEQHRVNFIVELRYVKGDALPLSPASGGDCCYIGGYVGKTPRAGAYMDAVAALARGLGGRPHWGKRCTLSAAELAPLYPQWDAFMELRRTVDPAGVFASAFTERVLGPVLG